MLAADGRVTGWLPGSLLFQTPLLSDAMPARFAMYTALAAGAIVAIWLAGAPARSQWRWVAAGLAIVSLVPASGTSLWWRPTPPSIRRNYLARLIHPQSTVISLPLWAVDDRALYAQAADGMRFRLIDRWMQVIPAGYRPLAGLSELSSPRVGPGQVQGLERIMCRYGIDYAIVRNDRSGRGHLLAALRLRPMRGGDLLVYRLPACTHSVRAAVTRPLGRV
ncbi:MAG: hypothetical protein ACLP01_06605 [Solirubrobacteraceae bacterium]